MKYTFTLLLALIIKTSFAQISFFKELNSEEEGSFPANFTEINGITFFSVKTLDGYNIWKTDGTEVGTVVVSTQAIDIHDTSYGLPNFHVFNNELYYYVQKPKIVYDYQAHELELWKTDGVNNTLVANEIPLLPLYYLNDTIYYLYVQGLFKIENKAGVIVKPLYPTYSYTKEPPILFNNQLIFYTTQYLPNGTNFLQIWLSDGTESGTTVIKNIDRLFSFEPGSYEHQKLSLKIDNQVYFVMKRISVDRYKVNVELWKTNGIETTFIKEIDNYDFYFDDNTISIASKLTNFNGKLLFNFYGNIWLSDGTVTGTNKVKTIQTLNYYVDYGKWGILNDKFYFAGFNGTNTDGYDFELWQSDGTTAGTILLKDINLINSASPNYFTTINNKLYFKTSNEQVWQSDGTANGTIFIQNIAKPANSPSYYQTKPELIYTSNNYLLYSYYNEQNGFELWKTNGITQSLLKNITTSNQTSIGSNKKIKVGNTWYFNGMDYRGAELWKSDGTPEGTVLIKDLNSGSNSSIIQEIVAVENTIYFTAIFTGENSTRLFKTNGTESGTVEISVYENGESFYPNYLTPSISNLYFKAYSIGVQIPWVSTGSKVNTKPLLISYEYYEAFSNLTVLGEKLFFTSNGLWISDGTQENTLKIFGNETINVPLNPICLIEFKNKLYFFSRFRDSQFTMRYALFESDGTKIGTKIVKEFDQNLIAGYALFLEKSSDKLYFRATFNLGVGFDLWTSNGTTEGTVFLKTISVSYVINPYVIDVSLKFAAVGTQFYIFVNPQYPSDNMVWTTDGNINGTIQILLKQNSPVVSSIIAFKCKLYFNLFDSNYGQELWESDGTIAGTHLTGEVITGTGNSHINNLLSFDNKLVFWANNSTSGNAMWQYLPPNTMLVKNQSTQSGNWNSSNTWSCGKIPSQDDIITIKSGHIITVPNNYQTTIKGISTENGAVLKIPQSAVFTVNPR